MAGIDFGSGFILIDLTWAAFKSIVTSKLLFTQYTTITTPVGFYSIFALDGRIVYRTTIYTGSVPSNATDEDGNSLSQGTNDSNLSDFETNYQTLANRPVLQSITISALAIGYTTTTSVAFNPLRASTYTEQSSNAQRSVSSSSASDASAGVGARTIRITYYTSAMVGPLTEDITLNGTTAVNTVSTTICYIESIIVLTVGSQLGNVGTITLFAATAGGGGAVGSILPGDNQTEWCHHYIPVNKTANIITFAGSIKGTFNGTLHLRRATPTVANTPEITIAPPILLTPGEHHPAQFFDAPITVAGPARVLLYVRPNNVASIDWQGAISYYEV